ncbi:putative quinol monooxygenase [Streptomyces sp. HUAS TT20]|jgi:quinol monooxygenase YgiN|uniref:putative quinol monooxygenase n=1 Tax=Streptomyces sp. HUAS TT20 TaxID=3447509 RepID=UPI0021DAF8E0|nr:putative quinol monooxygenase [Streptomyces sp. HUAS 15-9]UXY32234.1 antibiotic biosynthesis monooxygenase [Streptomyces sp. HUAS 15-9]
MSTTAASYTLLVRFRVRTGAQAAFDALTARTVDLIRKHEPGTLLYAIHTTGVPTERIFYELYEDQEAFAFHERQPHIQEFLAARGALLQALPEVTVLTPTAISRRTAQTSKGDRC